MQPFVVLKTLNPELNNVITIGLAHHFESEHRRGNLPPQFLDPSVSVIAQNHTSSTHTLRWIPPPGAPLPGAASTGIYGHQYGTEIPGKAAGDPGTRGPAVGRDGRRRNLGQQPKKCRNSYEECGVPAALGSIVGTNKSGTTGPVLSLLAWRCLIIVGQGSTNRIHVIEAWDAKYGKPYLRDELEELADKLDFHDETIEAGFVVDRQPEIDGEITTRMEELQLLYNVVIHITSFDDWVLMQLERVALEESEVMSEWLVAYAESLALRRRELAPIDEPADRWVEDLLYLL